MLQKILNIGIATLLMLAMNITFIGTIAHADTPATPPSTTINPSDLLRPYNYTSGGSNDPGSSKIAIVKNISDQTQGTWQQILGNVIKFILAITGTLAFISFTAGGILMVSAQGKEEQIKKGKQVLIWSILALAIIATSYALVLGVSSLQFNTP